MFGMARRRQIGNEKLTETDLAALRLRLSTMTLHDLESFYKATHNACRYTETRAPAPAVVGVRAGVEANEASEKEVLMCGGIRHCQEIHYP